jgi:tRNA uridine 5-carboxymethylaminomethyl modification enzyme
VDRRLYREAVQRDLGATANLTLEAGSAEDLLVEQGRVCGVRTAEGAELRAAAVILTTGTFLRGRIHLGAESWPAGRVG